MALLGILVALSIVLGKVLSITVGAFRFSLENLPVLLGGIWCGPVGGLAVGVVADLLGSLLVGFAINPIITVGAGVVGLVAGLVYHGAEKTMKMDKRLLVTIYSAHFLGSVIIKSIGLLLYYGYPIGSILLRVPLYLGIGFVEFLILRSLVPRVRPL